MMQSLRRCFFRLPWPPAPEDLEACFHFLRLLNLFEADATWKAPLRRLWIERALSAAKSIGAKALVMSAAALLLRYPAQTLRALGSRLLGGAA